MTLQQEWLTDPEFSKWISGVPGDDFVYCKLCKKELGCKGKSALRAHASGEKHSKLEQSLKKKPRKSTATSSKTSGPARHLGSGKQSAKVNINFMNVPGCSTASNAHQNISTSHRNQKHSSSLYKMPKSSNAQSLRGYTFTPSPTFSSSRSLSNASILDNSYHSAEDRTEQLRHFEQAIDEMFDHQSSIITNGITSIFEIFGPSLRSANSRRMQEIFNSYKSSSKNLRTKVKLELLRAFLQ